MTVPEPPGDRTISAARADVEPIAAATAPPPTVNQLATGSSAIEQPPGTVNDSTPGLITQLQTQVAALQKQIDAMQPQLAMLMGHTHVSGWGLSPVIALKDYMQGSTQGLPENYDHCYFAFVPASDTPTYLWQGDVGPPVAEPKNTQ
jgi:hypothetical protein